jgi:hypothetical protein
MTPNYKKLRDWSAKQLATAHGNWSFKVDLVHPNNRGWNRMYVIGLKHSLATKSHRI